MKQRQWKQESTMCSDPLEQRNTIHVKDCESVWRLTSDGSARGVWSQNKKWFWNEHFTSPHSHSFSFSFFYERVFSWWKTLCENHSGVYHGGECNRQQWWTEPHVHKVCPASCMMCQWHILTNHSSAWSPVLWLHGSRLSTNKYQHLITVAVLKTVLTQHAGANALQFSTKHKQDIVSVLEEYLKSKYSN